MSYSDAAMNYCKDNAINMFTEQEQIVIRAYELVSQAMLDAFEAGMKAKAEQPDMLSLSEVDARIRTVIEAAMGGSKDEHV